MVAIMSLLAAAGPTGGSWRLYIYSIRCIELEGGGRRMKTLTGGVHKNAREREGGFAGPSWRKTIRQRHDLLRRLLA